MNKDSQERISYANEMFAEYSDVFSQENKKLILEGKIAIGMSPFEARLAGGAFFYGVSPDLKKWHKDANPFDVMWAQTLNPDNSEIWMLFENSSQFLGRKCRFKVHFKLGRAFKIEEEI